MTKARKSPAGQASIRLHVGMLARADALVPKLQERNLTRYPAMNRSDVLRIAIEHGLAHLETEFKS